MAKLNGNGPHVGIFGVEYYLPEKVLTSADIAAMSGLDQAFMETKLGIKSVHVTAKDECASDLAVAASEKLFASTGFPRERVEAIVLCTQTPDYKTPATACLVQDRLHIPKSCMAFDINQGCSGYPYSLATAASLVKSGVCRNALLIMSDTLSKAISYTDKTVCGLFGDGAAATLLLPAAQPALLSFTFGTDGTGFQSLIIPAGGTRLPSSPETRILHQDDQGNWRSLDQMLIIGRDIFEFMLREAPASVASALADAGLTINDVKLFVFHQPNKFMLEFLFRRMGVPSEKTVVCMENTGNTGPPTIPIALKHALCQGRIQSGDAIVLCGFGAGLSWGTAVLRWCDKNDWTNA